MNLYRISQAENDSYDTFDSAIVVAETENRARCLHPQDTWDDVGRALTVTELSAAWASNYPTWASSPAKVAVTLIGEAAIGTPEGVILASFNAG